jgi:hypothetical protein
MLQDPKINPMVSPTPPPIIAPILKVRLLVFAISYEVLRKLLHYKNVNSNVNGLEYTYSFAKWMALLHSE